MIAEISSSKQGTNGRNGKPLRPNPFFIAHVKLNSTSSNLRGSSYEVDFSATLSTVVTQRVVFFKGIR